MGSGTYTEQLTITKDGISLIGRDGAVLVPPASMTSNTCSGLAGPGTEAGICVSGAGVKFADFIIEHRKVLSVTKPVADVLIQGMEVRNFSGVNVALVGTQNAVVDDNKLVNGPTYGFLTAGSIDTQITNNAVTFAPTMGFIGLCNDNKAGAEVANNKVSGYNVGLCIQTPGAQIHDNDASNNCIGAFVDPHLVGASVYDNYFGPTNPQCPPGEGLGVIVSGAMNAHIQGNFIEGQKSYGYGAGIAMVDDSCTEVSLPCTINPTVSDASGNVIEGNTLRNNDLDIFVNVTMTNNVVKYNRCTTSSPAGLCG